MIKGISHIGVVVADGAAAEKLWTGVFGFKRVKQAEIAAEGIRSTFLSAGGGADEMMVELMEPLDKSDMSNAVARRLARRGEGFYHLAIDVDSVEVSAAALKAAGLRVIDRPAASAHDAPRWLVHPKDANGVMVEGVVRDGSLIDRE